MARPLFTSLKQVLILSLLFPLMLSLFGTWILCTTMVQSLFRDEAYDSDTLSAMSQYQSSLSQAIAAASQTLVAFDSAPETVSGVPTLTCGCGTVFSASSCAAGGVLTYRFVSCGADTSAISALSQIVSSSVSRYSAYIESISVLYDGTEKALVQYPCPAEDAATFCGDNSVPSVVAEIRTSADKLGTGEARVAGQRIWRKLGDNITVVMRMKIAATVDVGTALGLVSSSVPNEKALWVGEEPSWWGTGDSVWKRYTDCVSIGSTCTFLFSSRGVALVFPAGSILGKNYTGVVSSPGPAIGTRVLFGTLVLPLFLALLLAAWVHVAADGVTAPFSELAKKLRALRNEDGTLKNATEIHLDSATAASSVREIQALYSGVEKVTLALHENVHDLPTREMLTFAELYEQHKDSNHRAAATCLNNIGNIHFGAGRYAEANISFEKAIELGGEGFAAESDPTQRLVYKKLCAFRTFQLGRSLYYQSLKEAAVRERAMKCLKAARELLALLGNHVDLLIQTLVYLSHCELEAGMTLTSSRTLQEAADMLTDWTKGILKVDPRARDFDALSPDILRQRIALRLGASLEKCGRHKAAFTALTKCIKIGERFDPNVRLEALKGIKQIMERNTSGKVEDVAARNLDRMIAGFGRYRKNVVVLFDVTEYAKTKSALSLSCLEELFETAVELEDCVSLAVFHKNPHVLFPLTEKWKNTDNLRGQIRSLDTFQFQSRTRALTKAFLAGLRSITQSKRTGGKDWLVVFTSGTDKASKRDKLKEIKEKLSRSSVGVIIFGTRGIGKEEETELRKMCGLAGEGFYVEVENVTGTRAALAAMSRVDLAVPPVIVEQFV